MSIVPSKHRTSHTQAHQRLFAILYCFTFYGVCFLWLGICSSNIPITRLTLVHIFCAHICSLYVLLFSNFARIFWISEWICCRLAGAAIWSETDLIDWAAEPSYIVPSLDRTVHMLVAFCVDMYFTQFHISPELFSLLLFVFLFEFLLEYCLDWWSVQFPFIYIHELMLIIVEFAIKKLQTQQPINKWDGNYFWMLTSPIVNRFQNKMYLNIQWKPSQWLIFDQIRRASYNIRWSWMKDTGEGMYIHSYVNKCR